MALLGIEERELNCGADVRAAIVLLKSEFGGRLTHDSGHGRKDSPALKPTMPTWIYTLPRYGNAQVAVRMNKDKLSLYLRARNRSGDDLVPLLGGLATIEKHYVVGGQNPPASLRNSAEAPYLQITPATPLIRVKTSAEFVAEVFQAYLS